MKLVRANFYYNIVICKCNSVLELHYSVISHSGLEKSRILVVVRGFIEPDTQCTERRYSSFDYLTESASGFRISNTVF